jgi:hypothetical protein
MGNKKNQLTKKEADKIFQRLKKKARPSERLKKYVHNTLLADHHYMFQFKEYRKRFGYCTGCGKNFDLETKNMQAVTPDDVTRLYAKHGEEVLCPVCGRTVTKRYAGYPHKKVYAMAGECRAEKNGALVIYTYTFSYDYSSSFRAKQEWCLEQIFYFDIHKYFQLLYGYEVRTYTGDKYSNTLNFTAAHSVIDIFGYSKCFEEGFHLIGFKEALDKSNLKYSCADRLLKLNTPFQLVSYLKFYCSYPVITERLVKEGHADILMSYINGAASGLFKFNKQTVPEFFGLDKEYYNFLRGWSVQPVNSFNLCALQFMKRNGIPASEEYFDFVSVALNYKKELDLMLKFRSFRKCVSYAKKQSLLCGCAYSYTVNVTHNFFMTYSDYISEGKKLNYDFTSESVVFPQNVSIAHQEQIEFERQQELEEEKRKYKNFEKRLKRLKKKYTFSDGKFLIRPAENSDELLIEGNELHHCVYSCYKDRYMEGDTDILFIRNCQEPDKPFYTLEYKNGNIVQCRTYHNKERTPEVANFLDKWKSFLKSNKTNTKKREVA